MSRRPSFQVASARVTPGRKILGKFLGNSDPRVRKCLCRQVLGEQGSALSHRTINSLIFNRLDRTRKSTFRICGAHGLCPVRRTVDLFAARSEHRQLRPPWPNATHAALIATMKTPASLQSLIDDGVIDEVIRPLKSGKEATVYLVRSSGETRCAKVDRDMAQRSFQKRAQYQEGRKIRGSRQARAMRKNTRFGRREQEAAWKNAEVEALYR